MNVLVAIPSRTVGCAWRTDALNTVRAWWAAHMPDLKVVLVDDGGDPFSRGGSLNQAMRQYRPDVMIASDGDVVVAPGQVMAAIDRAYASTGLVQPFDELRYLDEEASTAVHVGADPFAASPYMTIGPSPAVPLLGSMNVISAMTWDLAGGWLPVFRGWGCEDIAFAEQCSTLAGPTWRALGPLVHLHHPKTGSYVSPERIAANSEAMATVLSGAGDPEAMRSAINDLLPA